MKTWLVVVKSLWESKWGRKVGVAIKGSHEGFFWLWKSSILWLYQYQDWVSIQIYFISSLSLYLVCNKQLHKSDLLSYIHMIISRMIVFHYQAKSITFWQANFFSFSLYTKVPISHSSIHNLPTFFDSTSSSVMSVTDLSG